MRSWLDFDWPWRRERTRRRRWDKNVPGVLAVHPKAFEHCFAAFKGTRQDQKECGLFWYGARTNSHSCEVSAVVVPKQQNRAGNFYVSGEAIEEVSDATRIHRWENLAQLHTHPGKSVEHSSYDDNMITPSVVSIVLPNYGLPFKDWPRSAGVHVFIDGQWRILSFRRATERINVTTAAPIPLLIDLRTQ